MLSFKLNNGVEIPCIGFGTWRIPGGEECVTAVKTAILAGYRHIDTAAVYGNETSVGRAIKESGISRDQLFVTSKLWNTEHSYDRTMKAFHKTLEDLQLDYLDLYLIHWPRPKAYRDTWIEANNETWRAFEDLYRAGKIRAIGVSNFTQKHLDPLMKHAQIQPMVNQIEINPGHLQKELVAFCRQHGILVEAWAPLAVGKVFGLPELQTLSEKYKRPISQILISWYLQNNILPLVKSVTESRIYENIGGLDLKISEEDQQVIENITVDLSSGHDPDNIAF